MAMLDRPTILLIDPDPDAAARLKDLLSVRCTVHAVTSAATARLWLAAAAKPPALVILELDLPDADGLLVCAELRARTSGALLVHTARSDQRDMLLSLRLGADDFVLKPGDPAEIEARVGALLRRTARSAQAALTPGSARRDSSDIQRVGDLVIDRERATATLGGRRLHLTQTEFRLLSAFARRIEEPLAREDLARVAGDYEYVAGTRSLDMHVRRLRAKLRAAREEGELPAGARIPTIVPVRGIGYRMTSPDGSSRTRAA